MNESIERSDTISVPEADLMGRVYDATVDRFHGEMRLAGADLRRARRLVQLQLMAHGRLSERHYELTDAGKTFVVGVRRTRCQP